MKTGGLLLDTCAAIWLGDGPPIRPEAAEALIRAERQGVPILISPISAWEIGKLVSKGRLALPMAPEDWFDRFLRQGVELAPLDPLTLVASSFLQESALRDPADCVIAATARALDATIVTRDRMLLGYAAAGHIRALAC